MLQFALPECCSTALAQQQSAESFYYSQQWLTLISGLYGYKFIPLTVTNEKGLVSGFLPLCHIQSPLTGSRLVSFPFSDHCPLLAEDEQSVHQLLDQAVQLARHEQVRYLELRTGVNSVLAARPDFIEGTLYSTWYTPLDPNPEVLWARLKKTVRNKVKKAQRNHVHVRFARGKDDILAYHKLHLRTRTKKHGMPSQPQKYFLELWDTFAGDDNLQVLLAEYEGTTVAGTILMCSGTTARFLYGASDERYLHLAPNNLLTWEAIAWACQQGYQRIAHGRTARANLGLMEFNRNWAAIETPLPYYYYPNQAGLASTSERSWRYSLLTSCWRRMPMGLAAALGTPLYKHLG
jgi:CelD/BcsL family acetyltransferase involved in cellulose biosynthesis